MVMGECLKYGSITVQMPGSDWVVIKRRFDV